MLLFCRPCESPNGATTGQFVGRLLSCFLDNRAAIIMGTHKESGATSFWSYTLNLPLSSNALVSWKFCYLLHKVLRGGHRNARLNFYSPTLFLFLFDLRAEGVSVGCAGCS